jgi:hypothetical protein
MLRRGQLSGHPGESVVFREFSEQLGGRLIAEASQPGTIVVGDKGMEVGIAFGVIEKAAVVGGAVLRHAVEMLAETAVEALDHAVGLRSKRSDEAVGDGVVRAGAVEGMLTGRFVVGFALFVDGKAVGEFGAVVGEHGVDLEREAVEEAPEEASGGGGPAVGEDLEIDKAGGPVDGDIGVGSAAIERRQVFDIDMDEAGWGVSLKGDGRRFFGGETSRDPIALQATMNSAARQRGIDAAPHRLGDVVERQGEAAAQLDNQGFLPFRQTGVEAVRPGRAVGAVMAGFPARHGAAVDAELAGQRGVVGLALLDVGAGARRRGGVGVQSQMHQPALRWVGLLQRRDRVRQTLAPVGPQGPPARRAARLAGVASRSRGSLLWATGTSCALTVISRSCKKLTACHNRAPSRQSPETKHLRRGDENRRTVNRSPLHWLTSANSLAGAWDKAGSGN